MSTRCIVFTGGGSGGHVYPGLAVIERLRETWDGRIVWIGSGKEVERQAVESAGIEFFSIPTGKLRRSLSLKNISDAFRVVYGFFAALRLLRSLKPLLVFSKGGYVSVPPCMAAAILGIPFMTHESDLTPGLATRINARRAERILVSWQRTIEHLSLGQQQKAIVVGNPVRALITQGTPAAGRAWLGFYSDLPIILALGGSQGASQINDLVQAVLPALSGKALVAHQTGAGHKPCRPMDDSYHGFEFVHDELPDVLAAADIIIGRAGAGTLWEGAASGTPMIFIPLAGNASRGDQVDNAMMMAQAQAAICLTGEDANAEALTVAILDLIASPQKRQKMAMAAKMLARPDAANHIASLLAERVQKAATT